MGSYLLYLNFICDAGSRNVKENFANNIIYKFHHVFFLSRNHQVIAFDIVKQFFTANRFQFIIVGISLFIASIYRKILWTDGTCNIVYYYYR